MLTGAHEETSSSPPSVPFPRGGRLHRSYWDSGHGSGRQRLAGGVSAVVSSRGTVVVGGKVVAVAVSVVVTVVVVVGVVVVVVVVVGVVVVVVVVVVVSGVVVTVVVNVVVVAGSGTV